jgi:hypothetical protein
MKEATSWITKPDIDPGVLLLETGFNLLLEDGFRLILEESVLTTKVLTGYTKPTRVASIFSEDTSKLPATFTNATKSKSAWTTATPDKNPTEWNE